MSRTRYLTYFVIISLCWGGSYLGIRYTIDSFSPVFAIFLRLSCALVFLSIYLFLRRDWASLREKTVHLSGIIALFSYILPWILLFWAESFVPPAIAAIMCSAVPIFVLLITPLLITQDKLSSGQIFGVLVAFCGIVVIFYPQLVLSIWTDYLAGLFALLAVAICYATGIVLTRKFAPKLKNEVNLFYQLLISTLVIFIVHLLSDVSPVKTEFSGAAIFSIFYLGIMCTVLAPLLFFDIIKAVGSVQSSGVTFIVPLVAILLDIIFLGEVVDLNELLGTGLILCGLGLINGIRLVPSRLKV